MSILAWFFVRWLINAAALILVSRVVAGVTVDSWTVALIAAAILGIVNAVIRPILVVFTLPINLVTLGLFTFIINAALLLLVASVVQGFNVEGFASALVASIVLWAVSLITNTLLHRGK